MDLLIATWGALLLVFLGVPGTYFLYMKRRAAKPWNLKFDEKYEPHVTILVPMHNEEKSIRFKLENLSKINYPADKLEVLQVCLRGN